MPRARPPWRADAWMYLRDTGERSSGGTHASITTNDLRARRLGERVAQLAARLDARSPGRPSARASSAYGQCGSVEQVRSRATTGRKISQPPLFITSTIGREPVARRLRDLRPGHLEGAVAAQHERPPAACRSARRARPARRSPSRRSSPARGSRRRARPARRGRRTACRPTRRRPCSRAVPREEAVHLAQQVGDAQRAAAAGAARRQVVGVAHALAVAAEPRAQQRADEVADADVGVGVEARRSRGRRRPRSSARA